ncbi:MAG: radical SAM protein [Bacteroidales bacterium]|nr:radical SAM protein [Bacteroidales bacterium]
MYRINEIFYSLQGEGFHTGTPAVFVRFSGCNLHCVFCDTQHQEGRMMSLPEIVGEVNGYPNAQMVVLTGGEPSLFVDDAFVRTLKAETGRRVAIETNGTRLLPPSIDWVTLSPKEAFEGSDNEPCVLTRCDELKVVYCGQNLQQYNEICAEHRFLQPCYNEDSVKYRANMDACVQAVLSNPGWRLSLQVHRLLGVR